jgi:hypothetical protein
METSLQEKPKPMNPQTDTDARRPAEQGGGEPAGQARGPHFDPRDPLHRAFGARVSRSFNRAGEETFVFVGSGEAAASSEFRLAPRGERGLLEEALDLDLSRYRAGPPRRRGGGRRWWEEGPRLFKVAYKEEAPAVETPEGKRAGMRLYLSGQPGEGERRANRKISVVVFGKEGFRPKAETEGGVRLDLLPLGARLLARVAVSREGFWKLMAARVRAGASYIEGAGEELPPELRLEREEEWDGAPLEGEPAPSQLAIGTEKTGEVAREEEPSPKEASSEEESSGEASPEEESFGAGEEEEAEDLAFAGDFGDGEAAAGGDGASFAEEALSEDEKETEPSEAEAEPSSEKESEKGPAELLSADGEHSADGSSAADASAGDEPEKTESKPEATEQAEQEKEAEAERQEEKGAARDSGEEGEQWAPEAAEEEEEAVTPPPAGALRPDIDWSEARLLPAGGSGGALRPGRLPTGHRDRKGRAVREGDVALYPDGTLRQVRHSDRMGLCFAGGRPYYEAGRRIGEPQVVARGFPPVPFRAHADVPPSSARREELAAEKRLGPIPFGD